MYNHYIRKDLNNIVIDRYSDWEGKFQTGDVLVETNEQRNYNFPITNERGQLIYKWGGSMPLILRTQSELDTEWSSRPPEPPSMDARLAALESAMKSRMGL